MNTSSGRLTRQHFALCRGYLEGAAIEGPHAAYGEPGTDVRVRRRLLATLRDMLAAAAHLLLRFANSASHDHKIC